MQGHRVVVASRTRRRRARHKRHGIHGTRHYLAVVINGSSKK